MSSTPMAPLRPSYHILNIKIAMSFMTKVTVDKIKLSIETH
jgi:hypothetical protein